MNDVKEVAGVSGGLLNMQEAADYLSVEKSYLYALCMRKQIPCAKIGRLNRFRKSDLDKWVQDRIQGEAGNYTKNPSLRRNNWG